MHFFYYVFQFQTFSIYPQKEGTAAASARPTTDFGSIGHCENDGFSIASPGNAGSPVICGYNSNQHSNTHVLDLTVIKHELSWIIYVC